MLKSYMKEMVITVVAFIWLLFVATNVNVNLGNIYLHFTLGSLALLIVGITIFDKKLHITFQRQPGGTLNAVLLGLVGWLVLLISSVVVLRFVSPQQASLSAVVRLMGATTPALANSKIANLLTFGVAIPFVETMLWARLLEFGSDLFGIEISKRQLTRVFSALVVLIMVLSAIFLFFHLTAKGITNTASLTVVFIMMMVSLVMVAIFGETRQAVFMHIWANTAASWLILFATGTLQI